jgi:hypothetical protein
MTPEVLNAVEIAAGAWASRDLVAKLLGPTAEYVGAEAASFARKCNINLNDIFSRAARMLGSKLDEPGQVSPRILKGVVDDGRFADEPIAAEYFAGILASSRSGRPHDDRGLPMLSVIRELSTYQLRLHYIFYSLVKRLYNGRALNLSKREETQLLCVFIPWSMFWTTMQADPDEEHDLISHCLNGLFRDRLIGDRYDFASPADLTSSRFLGIQEPGLLLEATEFGAELFLWANGKGDLGLDSFLDSRTVFRESEDVVIRDGAVRVRFEDEKTAILTIL